MEDLELLHHFTTQTCFTLSDRPESHALWQVTVPQIAFEHDFLMRGILAISALHLSWQGKEKADYWAEFAVRQQDAALSTFRDLMSKMDESYCDAFFALSSLIVVYGFVFPKAADSLGLFDYHGEHSDDWLPLIRGVYSIIMSLWPNVKAGRISGLLHDHQQEPPRTQMPETVAQHLESLRKLCEEVSEGEEAVLIYREAIEDLTICLVRMLDKRTYECEVSIAFLWPVMIKQGFVSRMNDRQPEALIILAYYCVILHQLDKYWWMSGWAKHIVRNIYQHIDESKRPWLQWPADVVGLEEPVLADGPMQSPNLDERANSGSGADTNQSSVMSTQLPTVLESMPNDKPEEM